MSNKVVAMTGASRGIGKAIALKYARKGFDIAICCRSNEKELTKVREEILAFSVNCLSFVGDMGNFKDAKAFFEQIQEYFGRIDILINNAGISHVGLLQDMTPEQWNTILSANLNSVFYCSKLAIKMMLPVKQGVLTNYGSTHEQDLYRIYTLRDMGYDPYVMVYDKPTAPHETRQLQRWVNNKRLFHTVKDFQDYDPKGYGKEKAAAVM